MRKEAGTLYLFTTGQKSVICNACTVSGATSESELKAGHALEVRASSGSGNEVKSQSQYDEWVLSDDEWKEVAMVRFILITCY